MDTISSILCTIYTEIWIKAAVWIHSCQAYSWVSLAV